MTRPPRRRERPTADDILAFVAAQPGKASKREIARHFGLKNEDRIWLKTVLSGLDTSHDVRRKGRRVHRAGDLPEVMVLDISGRDADGDLLARPTEWDDDAQGPAPTIRLDAARRRDAGPVPGVGDHVLAQLAPDADEAHVYRARIIKVLPRRTTRIVGVFRRTPDGGEIEPVDKKSLGRTWRVRPGDEGKAKDGDLVGIDVMRAGRFGAANARVREIFGALGSEAAVSMIALAAHDIPHVFDRAVLAEAETIEVPGLAGREDWRDLPLVTIDPADAKDHDDAVHAAPDPAPDNRGGFVVTVAIADVAAAVRPGSLLDDTARERGNSVYFPDRVVPMLPERISNGICSLKPGEPRGAIAVRMVIGADGVKRRHSFHRVLMRSAGKLAYPQAQAAIDGHPDDTTGPLLDPVLRPLWAAYHALVRARRERAPLDLDLPERKHLLKADGTLDRVIVPPRLDAHKLIEEMMILANVAAAETLEAHKTPLLYRVHDAPSPEKLSALREFLQTLDISIAKGANLKPSQFNGILARVRGTANETLVNEVVLRSQAQAEYAPENYGHFGLALRRYAHFTSPIRRYADLVVHRGLIRALRVGDDGLTDRDIAGLAETAAHISAAERRAMHAERETADRLIAHFLAARIGATFEARIGGATRAGLFVTLAETGADGFVPASTVGNEYFRLDEVRRALVGDRTGTTFQIGDAVEVRLVEAQPAAGALRFEIVSEGKPGRPQGRGAARAGFRGRRERLEERGRGHDGPRKRRRG